MKTLLFLNEDNLLDRGEHYNPMQLIEDHNGIFT